jgi:predicted TIM-barrel fold metal-dependent hydrolase
MQSFSNDKNVFMKLSGAFNEFDTPTPEDIPSLLTSLTPFLQHVFHCFPQRVMFGSDWPVCNVGGPKGEKGNWTLWRGVVEAYLEEQGMGEEEMESVWWKAGCEGYGVEM